MECYCHLRVAEDLHADGQTHYERRFNLPFGGPIVPFRAEVTFCPISSKDQGRVHLFGTTSRERPRGNLSKNLSEEKRRSPRSRSRCRSSTRFLEHSRENACIGIVLLREQNFMFQRMIFRYSEWNGCPETKTYTSIGVLPEATIVNIGLLVAMLNAGSMWRDSNTDSPEGRMWVQGRLTKKQWVTTRPGYNGPEEWSRVSNNYQGKAMARRMGFPGHVGKRRRRAREGPEPASVLSLPRPGWRRRDSGKKRPAVVPSCRRGKRKNQWDARRKSRAA